jgi:hypothetical protein
MTQATIQTCRGYRRSRYGLHPRQPNFLRIAAWLTLNKRNAIEL